MFSETNMGWYFFSEVLQNWDWTIVFTRLKIHFEPAGGAWIGHSCPQAFTSSAGHQIWNWLQCLGRGSGMQQILKGSFTSRMELIHIFQYWRTQVCLGILPKVYIISKTDFLKIFFLNNRAVLTWCKAYIASFVATLCCYASLGKETVPVLSRLKLLKLF